MFISYIIPHLCGETYLIRCIESIYEQPLEDFEVIIAEYHFNTCKDYIKELLNTKSNFKVIEECKEEDKLKSAIKMIDKNAKFIQFLDSSTVATPHTVKTLKSVSEKVDLIIPSTIIRVSDGFKSRFPNGLKDIGNTDVMDAFDYCFSKTLFDKYENEIIVDLFHIEMLIDVLLSIGTPFKFTEETCYYIVKSENSFDDEKLDYDKLQIIASNIKKSKIDEVKVKLFTKYIHRLMCLIESDKADEQEQVKAYEILKKFGEEISDNYVMSKIFNLNTGVHVSDLENIDLSGYKTLKEEIFKFSNNTNGINVTADKSGDKRKEEIITAIKVNMQNMREKYAENSGNMNKIREDISSMSKNLHYLMQKVESNEIISNSNNESIVNNRIEVTSFSDPVMEVPYLYATGKLGLKTIVKSFRGWFRYKLSRKK